MEILPSEAGNIAVPVLDSVPIEKVREILKKVDRIVRQEEDIEQALNLVDNEILVSDLYIDKDICSAARNIWKKMQRRRLKRG